MNAVDFVKKYGWDLAQRDVVCLETGFITKKDFLDHYGFEILDDLKRLVDSWELVEKHGGLIGAKKEAEKLEWSNQSEWYNKLIKAIADVESVGGWGVNAFNTSFSQWLAIKILKPKANVLSLFDGISAGRLALERAGIEVGTYYRSEIDKFANKVAMHHYPDDVQLGDVIKWREWDIDWASIDMLIGGSPCQGFSFAGKQLAFDDPRSALFFVYVDILNHIKSFNPNVKFMLENVKMKKEFVEVINEHLCVEPVVINSALMSAQNRVRLYWCNWDLTQPEDKGILLRDIMEDIEPDRPCVRIKEGNEGHIANATDFKAMESTKRIYGADGKAPTLTTMGGGHREPKVLINDAQYRKLTPTECARLQTFPDGWAESIVSNSQSFKAYGNSWTVDVVAHIFKSLVEVAL